MPKRTKSLRQLLVDLSTRTKQANQANRLSYLANEAATNALRDAVAVAVAAIDDVEEFPFRCPRHSFRLMPDHNSVEIVLEALVNKSDNTPLRAEYFWRGRPVPGYDAAKKAVSDRLSLTDPWKASVLISGYYFEEDK
jgi:hypothetical protein